ncbi:MAG: bifunctional enoyl-CoA hydratase/phosphate acetyltransferase [Defluviitaleaceae bacterium]|nr:bifunctional enoyl-CoA hydratase/phosphate acetyltransferase [Defluviitaleaceae bacterium]
MKELFDKATQRTGSIVSVAAAADHHVLEAASAAKERGIADFVLFGDLGKINEIASQHQINICGMEISDEPDNLEACRKAVALVAEGKANALMKGLVDTSVIMKAALDREHGIRTDRKLSHISVFELTTYHKLLFVTDAAINIAPDLQGKKEIVENAVAALYNLGIARPKTALLAAKEKPDDKMPVTLEYVELVKMAASGELSGCVLDGPFALDNAVSKESAEIKGIDSPVAGDADLLVCPDIEAGNILYKSLAFLAGAKNGGVVVGAKRPIILTSRADSSESKLISIVLGVLF